MIAQEAKKETQTIVISFFSLNISSPT